MAYKEKFDKFLKQKNLTTTNNRKKVGILFFLTTIALFFLFVTRLAGRRGIFGRKDSCFV